jgi:inosine-uridine nucleoside N-ribohydrolase
MSRKIIIDTDPGHDDVMALMLACKSPEFDVVAVTTVCGNSTIENTTRNARYIIDFIKRNDIPVYSGAATPLRRDLIQAVVHGTSGLDGINPTNDSALTGDAVEQILQLIKQAPNEITIVTLGPLTNIAKAIQKDPETMLLVKEIVSMGGAIDVPGNKNRVAEFNIFVDPDAAKIVMDFPITKTLVPLDACNHIMLHLTDLAHIKDESTRSLFVRMLAPYIANLERDADVSGALMYDPLTVFYLLQPEVCRTSKLNVLVETEGEVTRGMTVIDKRKVTDHLEPNVTVVTHIEADPFITQFIATMNT